MLIKYIISPKVAIYLAALFIGRPDIIDDLLSICHRESRCTAVKTHAIDAHISDREWYGQVSWGHLDPECQKKDEEGGWATHGSLGLSSGAHWSYLPPCYNPRVLNKTWVSALLGARKYVRNCWMVGKKRGWCRVPYKVRKNNIKSPRLKKAPKFKRPKNWLEFILQNPW